MKIITIDGKEYVDKESYDQAQLNTATGLWKTPILTCMDEAKVMSLGGSAVKS